MCDRVAGGLGPELVSVVLIPDKSLKDSLLKDKMALSRHARKVLLERKGFQPLGIVA